MKALTIPVLASLFALAGPVTGQESKTERENNPLSDEEADSLFRDPFVGQSEDRKAPVTVKAVSDSDSEAEKPAAKPYRGDNLVHVIVRIFSEKQSGEVTVHSLLDQSSLVVEAGEWTSFGAVREMHYPTEYDPPSISDSLSEQLRGAGFKFGAINPDWPTNDAGALIPSHAKNYESRDLGLDVKLRPRIGENGRIDVDFEFEQSAFNGFINYGAPVTAEQTGPLGKTKTVLLMKNRVLLPVFQVSRQQFAVSTGKVEGAYRIKGGAPPGNKSGTPIQFEPDGITDPPLPTTRIVVEAMRIETGLKPLAVPDPETKPVETRSWALSEKFRRAINLNHTEPGAKAAAELTGKLAELGIPARNAEIDAKWTLNVTGSSAALDRIDALLTVYKDRPQIFVASKFISSPDPLESLGDAVMDDAETQEFVRKLAQLKGVDLLSAPSIMLAGFQSGKMEVAREFIYPVSYDRPQLPVSDSAKAPAPKDGKKEKVTSFPVSPAAPKEFRTRNTGVHLELKAHVFEDKSIQIEALPELVEFLGFNNYGESILLPDKGVLGKYRPITISENRIEMPVFSRRDLKVRARIPNGSSILVGGFKTENIQMVEDRIPILGDLPVIGKAARKETEVHTNRYIYILLTAKTVDPAGTAIAKAE